MSRRNPKIALFVLAIGASIFIGGTEIIHSKSPEVDGPKQALSTPIIIDHKGKAPKLDRAPVIFDHDTHTKVLLKDNPQNCALCHVVKERDPSFGNSEVQVFKFPKKTVDMNDKSAIMYGYHDECISCHKKMRSEGKKTGPQIGMCGKCHDRRATPPRISWTWKPIFNYKDHAKHVETVNKLKDPVSFNITGAVPVQGTVKETNKNCVVCHHVYDEKLKKLYYKSDTENECSACHKSINEKNARSMANVSHAACIGCHIKVAKILSKDPKSLFRDSNSTEKLKKAGPTDCKGCHGEHKIIPLKEIAAIPRLERGQKDIMDLPAIEKAETKNAPGSGSRMQSVPFNHKSHEPRVQFCNSCHHYSLEKCANCHKTTGDLTKGGGITYERAFHLVTAKESCAGCHVTATKTDKCAGCHQWIPAELPKSSCPVCHSGPSGGKLKEAPLITLTTDKEKFPEKVIIKNLEKEFQPVDFIHAKIANKLTTISNESTLARTFHARRGEMAICFGCHHRVELNKDLPAKFPPCVTCHSRAFDPKDLGRLGLLGAYHRQCIGCHEAMHGKPLALECVKCHAEKKGVKTDQLIPPLDVNGSHAGTPVHKGE
ncbi:MAG: cytochrome c3 family protein [Deltaproteobacteria bacterium]|nr:cytochrome c3 family protein [Deltaproteobacteria bacterium]